MKTIRCSSLPIIAKCQAPFHATGALRVNHDGGIAAGGGFLFWRDAQSEAANG
jgi:hypothetical protein